jgi:hypothetical protein
VDEKPSPGIFDLLTIVLASALMIGGALAAGLAIDAWLHTGPIATMIGLAVGIVSAVGATVHQIRRFL